MKNIAIIAEYNPLHNGHLYHMASIKENNNIIVALSGNFTERGDVAIQNKYNRAKNAVLHGASMVVEIPSFGVLSCAEHYAQCAVRTLSLLGNIDTLSFGSEEGDIDTLNQIASIKEDEISKDILNSSLKSGDSYPKALSKALANSRNIARLSEILSSPNNILGIEYIKALKGTQIAPHTIKRCGNNYNDQNLSNNTFASATSIRNNLASSDVQDYLPSDVYDAIKNVTINNDGIYHALYQKLIIDSEDVHDIINVNEGIENRIMKALNSSNSYEELIANIKTKRYTLSRIKRMLLDILLGIKKDLVSSISTIDYVRVLAIRKDSLNMLSDIRANVITKYNDNARSTHPFIDIDLRADKLYNVLSSDKIASHQMLIID